jgi:ubiquinone biosynthesis protein
VAYEAIGSLRPVVDDVASFDGDAVIAAAAAITIESALRHGCFHADLRLENLLVGADGELVIVGCGTLGRLDVATRRSALEYLTAVLSGDFDGQINAMRLAGAVPDHVDVGALRRDLEANEALDPMLILGGGEASLVTALREAVTLLVRHRLRPPLDVVMFVRSVFALRALIHRIDPERSLMAALFPLLQRLPDLRASLDDR